MTRNSKMAEWFTTAQAAAVSGLSIDMVNYLCRYDLVMAGRSGPRVRGRRRRFLFPDLILLKVIARLLENGISVLRLKRALLHLQQGNRHHEDLLTRRFVATDGVALYVLDRGVWEILGSRQLAFAFVFEIPGLRREVAERARAVLAA